jgi:hypothetical protein
MVNWNDLNVYKSTLNLVTVRMLKKVVFIDEYGVNEWMNTML